MRRTAAGAVAVAWRNAVLHCGPRGGAPGWMGRAVGRRHQATAGGGSPLTPEQAEQLKKLSVEVQARVKAGSEEMRTAFGGEHADKLWMMDYYRHRQHKYLVPAAVAMTSDEKAVRMPSLAAKNAIFFAHVLRDLPADAFSAYTATLPFVLQDIGFLLAVLHHAGTPAAKGALDRLGATMRRKGDRSLIELGQTITAVPVADVDTWPFACVDASFADRWQSRVHPWEVAATFKQAKDMLQLQDYCLLSSTTVLECLWSAFYATGDRKYVARILELGGHWAEFSDMPDQVAYLTSITTPLPTDLTEPAKRPEGAMRNARAQASRAALWSLLQNARRHQVVMRTVAEEVGKMADFCVEPGLRDAPAVAALGLDDGAVSARLDVYPSILHLIARSVLDAPFPATDARTAATTPRPSAGDA